MKATLSQQERTRLYRLLAQHQADALTLHRVKQLMDDLADWPEEWDQLCQQDRVCRVAPDRCRHRDEGIVVSKRAEQVVRELLEAKSKNKQLTPDLLSLVEKFAPELLPDEKEPEVNGAVPKSESVEKN